MTTIQEAYEYSQLQYLWPPRPDNAIPPAMLGFYAKRGYVAQVKKNGACTVLVRSPKNEITAYNRHNDLHKLWTPDPKSPALRRMAELPEQWFVFAGELLHSKVPGFRDTLYLFDIMVAENRQLVGETFASRQSRIHGLWDFQGEHDHYSLVDERLWVAKPLININFQEFYEGLTEKIDEGLVLKDPNAKLELCRNATVNNKWQVKCRKEHKNYTF